MPSIRHLWWTPLIVSAAAGACLLVAHSFARADRFDDHKQRAVERCQAIDENAYSTGMIFNSKGQATMFERSRCFQDLAIAERDLLLCKKVVERKSWFFDGSAISEKSCLKQVGQRIESDRKDFASRDFSQLHRLRSFALARNGNGKDYNFELETEGSTPGSYELKLIFTPVRRGKTVTAYDKTSRFAGNKSRKVVLLRHSLLNDRLGEGFDSAEWSVTALLQYSKTASNRLYYDAIPANLVSSRLERRMRFADLPPWRPEPVK